MKKIFVILCMVLPIGFTTLAQTGNEDADSPVMNFEFETHNFGEIQAGDEAEVDFTFVNTGKEKLYISNVKASCGCTTPFWSKEPVLPGEESKITARYNTKNKSGSFNKSITISSNASEATKRIFIKGNVIPAPTNNGVPQRIPSIVNNLGE